MEFLDVFDTKLPLPSNVSCKQGEFVSDTTKDLSESKRERYVPFTHLTKQPRNMVECFLEVTGCRRPRFMKRFGSNADATTFTKEFFIRKNPTERTREPKAKRRTKKFDLEFVRRPILVEKHSSDEDAPPNLEEEDADGDGRGRRRSWLVTQRHAKYRERVAREKKRIEDTKRAFARMAEEEATDKRKARLVQEVAPSVRPTRGTMLRDQLVLGGTTKRRECSWRTHAPPQPPHRHALRCNRKRPCHGGRRTAIDHQAEAETAAKAALGGTAPPPTAFVQRPRPRPGGRGPLLESEGGFWKEQGPGRGFLKVSMRQGILHSPE